MLKIKRTAFKSNPHISAGNEAFSLHVAGLKELPGLIQEGDVTPFRSSLFVTVNPDFFLLHAWHSLTKTCDK